MPKIHLLSLGCPKNLVDSEKLLKRLKCEGLQYSLRPEESDIILVNTCGFIGDAKRESIEEILKAAELKGKDRPKKLLVFGCLAERSGMELRNEIPEIDALWGVGKDDEIVEYCRDVVNTYDRENPPQSPFAKGGLNNFPTLVGGGKGGFAVEQGFADGQGFVQDKFLDTPYAYLKIAEGCDRKCSYCVIPGIRGPYRSNKPEEILEEADDLIRSGVRELILVAQDITSYGRDMKGYDLNRLVRELASLDGDFRVRLLYLYPSSINDRLLETIGSEEKVCNYIDMPLQHASEKILRLMGRAGSGASFEKLVSRIRDIISDVNIRTSLIVGFPQETAGDFEELAAFIQRIRFDRLGVFMYSKEEGTPAYKLKGQVPKKLKKERFEKIMELQAGISLEKNKSLVGRTFRALVDERDDSVAIARLYSQAPEIDGVVLIEDKTVAKGDFVEVEITEAYDYDLKGVIRR